MILFYIKTQSIVKVLFSHFIKIYIKIIPTEKSKKLLLTNFIKFSRVI